MLIIKKNLMCILKRVIFAMHFQHIPYCATAALAINE